VKTEKDIWELVRQKIDMDSDSSKEDSVEEINKKDNLETIEDYQFEINRTEKLILTLQIYLAMVFLLVLYIYL